MNFKSILHTSSFLLIFFISSSLSAQTNTNSTTQEKRIKVLFVGNSFTYYNNLPQVVSAMAKSQNVNIDTKHSTIGGSSLENHWKSERGTQTRIMIELEKWDYVVFNNHSLSSITSPDKFLEYSKKFADLVRSKGAEPIFMMTWAYKSNPLMLPQIEKMHKLLCEQTNTNYIPGGPLFASSIKYRPDIELFHDDIHPSSNGTYLLGLALYKYFTGKTVTGIPGNISTLDTNGQILYLIFMKDNDVPFLQQLVNEFTFKTLDLKIEKIVEAKTIMSIQQFKEKLKTNPTAITYAETIQVIDDHYNFTPTAFTNGKFKNKVGENSGSNKIFAFALKQKLTKAETLYCFGENYKTVLSDVNGTSYYNIRTFMKSGLEGLVIDSLTLSSKK
ncbi:HopJ type III effector protein [uncultured Polaribacter sp.]|uniref:HopJ type III effector protein n=1 Tax=uncultured Polaribacter sp. TaxID=174711 RepID=UPI0030D7A17B|tara:strand:- start:13140 stop:14300 length:1161 start_codon:yes stop_codon:yes gene_type:complete